MDYPNAQPLQATTSDIIDIDYYGAKKAAMILRSINNELRQAVIRTIYENTRLTVTQLYEKLQLEQSVASQHLAILRRSAIVSAKRDGKYIYYSINKERIAEINQFVRALLH